MRFEMGRDWMKAYSNDSAETIQYFPLIAAVE